MDDATAARLDAIEQLLAHALLLLETEPRFTAERFAAWLEMVGSMQEHEGLPQTAKPAAALWARISGSCGVLNGCDLLDAARDKPTWKKVTESAISSGPFRPRGRSCGRCA